MLLLADPIPVIDDIVLNKELLLFTVITFYTNEIISYIFVYLLIKL